MMSQCQTWGNETICNAFVDNLEMTLSCGDYRFSLRNV